MDPGSYEMRFDLFSFFLPHEYTLSLEELPYPHAEHALFLM